MSEENKDQGHHKEVADAGDRSENRLQENTFAPGQSGAGKP